MKGWVDAGVNLREMVYSCKWQRNVQRPNHYTTQPLYSKHIRYCCRTPCVLWNKICKTNVLEKSFYSAVRMRHRKKNFKSFLKTSCMTWYWQAKSGVRKQAETDRKTSKWRKTTSLRGWSTIIQLACKIYGIYPPVHCTAHSLDVGIGNEHILQMRQLSVHAFH